MKKNYLFILSALFMVGMTSCLKDKEFEDQKYGIQIKEIKGVAFPKAASSPVVAGIFLQDNSQSVIGPSITLEIDGTAETDVHIKLVTDDAAVVAENLTPLPTDSYTLSTSDITIPAGAKFDSSLKINILNSNMLDPTKTYGLGIKINEADNGYTISANSNTIVYKFVAKNIYEGDYQATGIFHHPVNGDRNIDEVKFAQTTGENSIQVFLGDLGPDYQMILTINPDNTVTIEPAGVTPNIDQHWGPNTYDPATKTFTLNYSYNAAAPRIIEETLVGL